MSVLRDDGEEADDHLYTLSLSTHFGHRHVDVDGVCGQIFNASCLQEKIGMYPMCGKGILYGLESRPQGTGCRVERDILSTRLSEHGTSIAICHTMQCGSEVDHMWCTARPPASMLRATVAAEGEASRLGQAMSAVAAVRAVEREGGGQPVDVIHGASPLSGEMVSQWARAQFYSTDGGA